MRPCKALPSLLMMPEQLWPKAYPALALMSWACWRSMLQRGQLGQAIRSVHDRSRWGGCAAWQVVQGGGLQSHASLGLISCRKSPCPAHLFKYNRNNMQLSRAFPRSSCAPGGILAAASQRPCVACRPIPRPAPVSAKSGAGSWHQQVVVTTALTDQVCLVFLPEGASLQGAPCMQCAALCGLALAA